MDEKEKLTVGDSENAQKSIISLVLQYPDFPSTFKANNTSIRWNRINDTTSIGIFPLQGAVYLKKYVSGSYAAQMPFQIVFRSSPTTNKASIDAQTALEELGKWLENSGGVEFKDPRMQLEGISRTSNVFSFSQDEKHADYGINMQLKYFYKK